MEIYYQGTDITGFVLVRKCIAEDASDGRCDSLELEFENAASWYDWGPKEDDEISVYHDGYDTGIMYLNTILPENGKFRILATSLPCKAREKTYRSFYKKSIEDIMYSCAMTSGMGYQIYGIDSKAVIPYIQQENESCAAFLSRLLKWEGACLKCVNGRYVAIGINWAQEQAVNQTIEITAKQPGINHAKNGMQIKELRLETPYGSARAEDLAVGSKHNAMTICNIPAHSNIQAGRYARGLLLHINRKCESLDIQSEFNPGFGAMTRINIEGSTDAIGEWIIEKAVHDFKNMTSTAKMRRCIRTIQ